MPIYATDSGGSYEIVEAGNHPAICYQMIDIGTVEELYMGETKKLHKVRISWELSEMMKQWKEGEPERPAVISKEFTLSMNDKATLRKFLASWRGRDFTPEEAKKFDVSALVGVPCLLNIIHKTKKDGSGQYADIGSISPPMKGMAKPQMFNEKQVLSYDNWNLPLFESLPDFIKEKMKKSVEYRLMVDPANHEINQASEDDSDSELPF